MGDYAGRTEVEWALARERMVREQLETRGIRDPRVLDAMRQVPRHLFVDETMTARAYADCALPIGEGQTISQPYMVAVMTQALAVPVPARVMEIGTGSGYQAAVLSRLASEVLTIEHRPDLAAAAIARLTRLGCGNVRVIVGDGSRGHAEAAPYDGILVTAGAPRVPSSLRGQLADGARLVIPVGTPSQQALTVVERQGIAFTTTLGDGCVFVPLVGEEAWPADPRGY
jgi:protein-L-isoaspartate(D-aspartate) O-methyltransferase